MKIAKWIAPILLSTLLLTACGEEDGGDKSANLKHSTGYNMISSIDHLAVVGSIDILKIIEKSGFESNPNLPMEASAGYKMVVKAKLDPEKTGIDLTGNNHFAVSLVDPESPEYVMFTAKILDSEKAKNAIQDLVKGTYTKEEKGGDTYHFVVEDEIAFGWDEKDIVIVFSDENDPKSVALDLLEARYVDGSDDDKGMEAYLEREDDMNVYVRAGNSVDFIKAQSGDFPEEFLTALEDSYYIGAGNFNDGDIVFEWDIHADDLKNSEFNALGADLIDESFYNFLTNDKLVAFGTASIDMAAIFNAMEYAQNKEFSFEKIEAETGLSKETMQEMFTGEFAVSLVDIKTEEKTIPSMTTEESDDIFFEEDAYSYNKEEPVVIFTAGIKDSAQIGELLRMSGEAKINGGVYQMDKDAFIAFHADKLILTTDATAAALFATGQSFGKYQLPSGVDNGSPLFGFVNTDPTRIPDGLMKMAQQEEGGIALEFLDLFQGIQFNGEFEQMVFKVEMNNKSENALKVITDFILEQVKEKQLI